MNVDRIIIGGLSGEFGKQDHVENAHRVQICIVDIPLTLHFCCMESCALSLSLCTFGILFGDGLMCYDLKGSFAFLIFLQVGGYLIHD